MALRNPGPSLSQLPGESMDFFARRVPEDTEEPSTSSVALQRVMGCAAKVVSAGANPFQLKPALREFSAAIGAWEATSPHASAIPLSSE